MRPGPLLPLIVLSCICVLLVTGHITPNARTHTHRRVIRPRGHAADSFPNATLSFWWMSDNCAGQPSVTFSILNGQCTIVPDAAGSGVGSALLYIEDQINNVFNMTLFSDDACTTQTGYPYGGENSCLEYGQSGSVFIQQPITDPYTLTSFESNLGCPAGGVASPSNIFMQGGIVGPNVCYLGDSETVSGGVWVPLYQTLTFDDSTPPVWNITEWMDSDCTNLVDTMSGVLGECSIIGGDPFELTTTPSVDEQIKNAVHHAAHSKGITHHHKKH